MKRHEQRSVISKIQDLNDHRRAVFTLVKDRVVTVRTGIRLMQDIAAQKTALLSDKG